MTFLDNRLPLKNYNQTTTKTCYICESCDIYQLLSAEIGYIYEIMKISTRPEQPPVQPAQLHAGAESPKHPPAEEILAIHRRLPPGR